MASSRSKQQTGDAGKMMTTGAPSSPRYDTMRVFGVAELCEHVLACFIPDILEPAPHKHVLRNCALRDLFRCRDVCRTFRDTIDASSKLRQALFLDPMPGSPLVVNCLMIPQVWRPFHHLEHARRFVWRVYCGKTGDPPKQRAEIPLRATMAIAFAINWTERGTLRESMFATQPPATRMEICGFFGAGFRREVRSCQVPEGIRFKDMLWKTQQYLQSMPPQHGLLRSDVAITLDN